LIIIAHDHDVPTRALSNVQTHTADAEQSHGKSKQRRLRSIQPLKSKQSKPSDFGHDAGLASGFSRNTPTPTGRTHTPVARHTQQRTRIIKDNGSKRLDTHPVNALKTPWQFTATAPALTQVVLNVFGLQGH
jgi:hypothetical protein